MWLFGPNPGGFFGKTDPSHNHLAPLAVNNLNLSLYNGATFTTAGDFTNNVTLRVDGSRTQTSSFTVSGALQNNGNLYVSDGSTVTIAGSFTNNGYLGFQLDPNSGSSGGTLTVGGAFKSVDNSGTLTGQWNLRSGEVYYDGAGGVNGTQDITTIASGAEVELLGPNAGLFGKTDTSHNHLAPLAVNNGSFESSQAFTTEGDFTNNGTVDLATYTVGGNTWTGSLTVSGAFHNVDNSGNLTGQWSFGERRSLL